MMMNSIMSASVLASVAETVSARDAAVAARAKKPRQTPGLKSHREIRIPVCTRHEAARFLLVPRSDYSAGADGAIGRTVEGSFWGDEKAPGGCWGIILRRRRGEKGTPRRAVILARRRLGRDREKGRPKPPSRVAICDTAMP